MRYFLILYLLLCCSMLCHAQHPSAWHLTEKDGLPSMQVYDLFQDSKGYMWMGTEKGLCKYSGQKFYYYKNVKQKGVSISGIQEDKLGRIWVRNFKEQVFYVENDSLYHFEPMEEMESGSFNQFMVDSKGDLWLCEAVNGNAYHYNFENKTWRKWVFETLDTTITDYYKGVYDVIEVGENEYIFSTGYGLYRLQNEQLKFVTRDKLLINLTGGKDHVIDTRFFQYKGELYLKQNFHEQYGIFKFVGDSLEVIDDIPQIEYLREKLAIGVRTLPNNTVWQLTIHGGVAPVFRANNRNIDGLQLFPSEGISDIILDHEGNYWLSSLKNGVHVIPNLAMRTYMAANSIFNQDVFGVLGKGPSDTLLLSTDEGEVLAYNTSEDRIDFKYKTADYECNQIEMFGEKLVVSGTNFQYIYNIKDSLHAYENPEAGETKKISIYRDSIMVNAFGHTGFSMVLFGRGKYFGTRPFPKEIFPAIEESYSYSNEGIGIYAKPKLRSSKCEWTLADEEGYRFFIVWDDMLMCYPEVGDPFPVLDNNGNNIQALKIVKSSQKIFWINTVNKGLWGLDKKLKVKYHFTRKDGLLDNYIREVVPTEEGLWLLTTHGIQFWDPLQRQGRSYTKHDGLPTHEIKDLEFVNGKLWVSTYDGLVSFDEDLRSQNNSSAPIYLKGVAINEKDTVLSNLYNLNYHQNTITIKIEGISYRSQGSFGYRYRMLGVDSVWRTQPSEVDFVRFFGLNPGGYTFEVATINEDGVTSSNSIEIKFVIATPYWKTWWFQGGLYLSGLLVIVGGILYRVRTRRQEEEQKNAFNVLRMQALQSQMNPHFIFNVLTAVQNMWLQHKNEAAMELQSDFANLLRKIFQHSSKLAITIDEVEDFLNNYLSLEQIRFDHTVKIDFTIDEDLFEDDYFIPPLLIQPIIENAFKHGLLHKKVDERNLKVVLKKEGPYLYCLVEDNGVGRKRKEPEQKRSSGLSTTKQRLKILQDSIIKTTHPNNNFKVTDLVSETNEPLGTRVELWIPFVDL